MKQHLAAVRKLLSEKGLYACIIPHTDPHQSEYIADYWKVMPFLTGFTGSTGNVVITEEFAGVWTDSRYFLQAEQELADSEFELVKLQTTPYSGISELDCRKSTRREQSRPGWSLIFHEFV